jgi:hypothetical protein
MCWLIVGSIIFWKGLKGRCQGATRKYLWANLIIGYIWLFVELVLAFAYPRPVSYPITTSVGGFGPTPIIRGGYRPSAIVV